MNKWLNTYQSFFAMLAVLVTLSSCNVTKKLPEEERLYTGSSIDFKDPKNLDNKPILLADLEDYDRPKPNKTFFGLRLRLWIYQRVKEPKKNKGIKFLLKKRIGEPPVLESAYDANRVALQMNQHLFSEGYFNSTVEVLRKQDTNKKVSFEYGVKLGGHYTIDTIEFGEGNSDFMKAYGIACDKSEVRSGGKQFYSLKLLEEERERIETELKNEGYYFFNKKFLVFRADTTIGNQRVRLILTLSEAIPEKAKIPYRIGEVKVDPEYSLHEPSESDTVQQKEIIFYGGDSIFRSDKIEPFIRVKPGDRYNRTSYELTVKKLTRLDAFDFVSVEFDEADSSRTLNTRINLTPSKKRSIRSRFNLVTKSNNFTGPNAELSWINRNLFKGAEYLDFTVGGGFETQILSGVDPLFSYEFNANAKYVIPKALSLLSVLGLGRDSITGLPPQTITQIGYRHVNRVQYYRLNSFEGSYGYSWRSSSVILHKLDLTTINFLQVGNVSEAFETRLNENIALKRSFESQFIIGPQYSVTITPKPFWYDRISSYVKLAGETAGNIGYLYGAIRGRPTATAADPFRIFGVPVAQFSKIDADGRIYFKTGKKSKLAMRQIVGYGIPYSRSTSLPFSRQFFSGGASSLRAFPFRSVGPGASLPDTSGSFLFIDQSGDIKLETSIEYRFPIQGVLRGAVFADAGNVWLQNNALGKPEGVFDPSDFMSELAAGVGAGLRLDIEFFVLRFDVATPIRKPYLPKSERWVIDDMAFGQKAWRQDNIVYNIAIGYPF